MMLGETVLTGASIENISRLQVMNTPAGYYLGTLYNEEDWQEPNSRETEYMTHSEATLLLTEWDFCIQDALQIMDKNPIDSCTEQEYWDAARYAYEQGSLGKAR